MGLSRYERRWLETLAMDGYEATAEDLAELRGCTTTQEIWLEEVARALEDLGYPPTAI
jgi:hypothetical protein